LGDKINSLDPEKQEKIIVAALKEFTANGYELASTNQIVEEAKISKGSLFYYFKTKKDLYKYLIEYSIDYVKEEFLNKIELSDTDLIEKYRKMSKQKLKAYTKNPHVFDFLGTLYLNREDIELPEDLMENLVATRQRVLTNIFDNIDNSLFRDDISSEQVIKLIRWSIEGYQNELITEIQGKNLSEVNFKPYWDEFDDFLDTLKRIYYRE